MKLLGYKINYKAFLLVLLVGVFSTTTLFAQRNQGQSKVIKDKVLLEKLDKLKPEMSKSEVILLLGEPYKVSFSVTEDDILIEDIYYKTQVWQGQWTIVIYQCVFKNSKLVALIQKEYFDNSDIGTKGPL